MQSGYGVSEMQQFLVEAGSSPLFSISTADFHLSPRPPPHHHHHHHYQQQEQQHYHLLPHQRPPSPQPEPRSFPHFHPIPITQQLFQQTQQFQLFQQEQHRKMQQQNHPHHHQLGLDQGSCPENSNSPARILGGASGQPPPFLGGMNFTLAVNGSCGGASSNEEGVLQEGDRSESQVHQWPRKEESAIKEPFWRPLDKGYNSSQHFRRSIEGSENEDGNHSASTYKLFSELEAICKPGVTSSAGANNQTGSGSALTGENPPLLETELGPDSNPDINAGSDTSTGDEEASLKKKVQKSKGSSSSRRKRKRKQQLSSIAAFFESLLKQLMDHQEGLHRKFLEALERRDQEKTMKEEAWRQQESAKYKRESMARAQERALVLTREAAIISYLEKITGESLNLPQKLPFQHQKKEHKSIEPSDDLNHNNSSSNSSRWPRAEVQALIRVRSSYELRFQEPGLKGPLWEEVSSTMASMGYNRSAKRCKEKWENINMYFRKTKDSAKKRNQYSKSCPYFHQLDQLYSKYLRRTPASTANISDQPKDNSELLHAIFAPTDTSGFKFSEMGDNEEDDEEVGEEEDEGEDKGHELDHQDEEKPT